MLTESSPVAPQASSMAMTPEEFAELRAGAASVSHTDVHLGRVLTLLVLHLGHAHGLDPAVEDAKAKAVARKAARDAEDARILAEAEALAELRKAEDAQPRTPLEREVLLANRAAEDAQVKAGAARLKLTRASEDAV